MRKFFLFAMIILMAGCATIPSQQEMANANYGQLPANYQDQIKEHFAVMLKDPQSAIYKFKEPTKHYAGRYGWKVVLFINAKNSFGGYTGEDEKHFMFYADGTKGQVDEFSLGFAKGATGR